jgi:hypothetical protein
MSSRWLAGGNFKLMRHFPQAVRPSTKLGMETHRTPQSRLAERFEPGTELSFTPRFALRRLSLLRVGGRMVPLSTRV